MSQAFNSASPESGVTSMGILYALLRDHQDAIRSQFAGSSAPANPLTGQPWLDTSLTPYRLKIWDATAWTDVGEFSVGYLNRVWVPKSFSGAAQTIDVDLANLIEVTATTAGSSIDVFSNPREGQSLEILNVGTNTFTINSTATIDVSSVLAQNDTATYVYRSAGTKWHRKGYSDNS